MNQTYYVIKICAALVFSLLYPYSNHYQVLGNGKGVELLKRDQKGCWRGKRLRNATLDTDS